MILPWRKINKHGSSWIWVFGGISGLILLLSFGREAEVSVFAPREIPKLLDVKPRLQIIDRSAHDTFLFFKSREGDLWYRDEKGSERLIASNVVRASFSPDGKKLAYGNNADELFITTTAGKRLGELTRVRDHIWSSNSLALKVSPVAADHSESEQTVVYNLEPETSKNE